MFSLTSLHSNFGSLQKNNNKKEQRGTTAYSKTSSPCTRTGSACASGGADKHMHQKRHICSLLIKAREKTLSKYKVTQGRLDLPCWVLQAFKLLFVQLGKHRVHRILCAEAANSRAWSSSPMPPLLVPPFKHGAELHAASEHHPKKCLQTVRTPYSTLFPRFPVQAQSWTPQEEEKEF